MTATLSTPTSAREPHHRRARGRPLAPGRDPPRPRPGERRDQRHPRARTRDRRRASRHARARRPTTGSQWAEREAREAIARGDPDRVHELDARRRARSGTSAKRLIDDVQRVSDDLADARRLSAARASPPSPRRRPRRFREMPSPGPRRRHRSRTARHGAARGIRDPATTSAAARAGEPTTASRARSDDPPPAAAPNEHLRRPRHGDRPRHRQHARVRARRRASWSPSRRWWRSTPTPARCTPWATRPSA